jgi:hypothetical protein
MLRAAVLAAALAALPPTAGGTAQPPGTPAPVVVDFLAIDENGEPVPDLTAADIALTAEGREHSFTDSGPSGRRRLAGAPSPAGSSSSSIAAERKPGGYAGPGPHSASSPGNG